jgi:hypothetical protein
MAAAALQEARSASFPRRNADGNLSSMVVVDSIHVPVFRGAN